MSQITSPQYRKAFVLVTTLFFMWGLSYGLIDVLNKRAYEMQDQKRVEIEIPEGKDAVIEEFNNALKESVAETSEEFMDKFFGGEDKYNEAVHELENELYEAG